MLTAAAFFILFCTGCILAFVRHPVFGLATYVALLYVHPPTQWWGQFLPSIRWSLTCAVITLIAVVFRDKKSNAIKLSQSGLFWGLVLFLCWLVVQLLWALDRSLQIELLVLMSKYTLLFLLIVKCIESERELRVFLWAHATGCFYLGLLVISQYVGGRFDGFRGPGIDEANAAALLIATGVLTTFTLFLSGKKIEKSTAVGFMPFTLNALIATISRSGFVALGVAGVLFNLFAPKPIVGVVRVFSIAGLILFVALTNPVYWERIGTILAAGEEVEGVDTGSNRLVLMNAQLEMFAEHPLGCGHRCTATLSPQYLDDVYLTTGQGGVRGRSSHNTFLTLLVEQGIPGAIFYVAMLLWIARAVLRLRKQMRGSRGLIPTTYAATVSIIGAITIGDIFVDYLKFEVRIWFLAILALLVYSNAKSGDTGPLHLRPSNRQARAKHN